MIAPLLNAQSLRGYSHGMGDHPGRSRSEDFSCYAQLQDDGSQNGLGESTGILDPYLEDLEEGTDDETFATFANDAFFGAQSYSSTFWSIPTDRSSLSSWSADDFDKEATQRVAELFAEIDAALYDNQPCSSTELTQECRDWARMFPHFRLVGKQIVNPSVDASKLKRPPSVILTRGNKRTNHINDALHLTCASPSRGLAVLGQSIKHQNNHSDRDEEIIVVQYDSDNELQAMHGNTDALPSLVPNDLGQGSWFKPEASNATNQRARSGSHQELKTSAAEGEAGTQRKLSRVKFSEGVDGRRGSNSSQSSAGTVEGDITSRSADEVSCSKVRSIGSMPKARSTSSIKLPPNVEQMNENAKFHATKATPTSRVISAAANRGSTVAKHERSYHQTAQHSRKLTIDDGHMRPPTNASNRPPSRLPPIEHLDHMPNIPHARPKRASSNYSVQSLHMPCLPWRVFRNGEKALPPEASPRYPERPLTNNRTTLVSIAHEDPAQTTQQELIAGIQGVQLSGKTVTKTSKKPKTGGSKVKPQRISSVAQRTAQPLDGIATPLSKALSLSPVRKRRNMPFKV